MFCLLRFVSSKFDVEKEDENPINPVYGQSLLYWIRDNVADMELEEPEPEDWGWYSYCSWKGRKYLLGSSATEINDGVFEWIFRVEKQRSFWEIISNKEKMTKEDDCLLFYKSLFEAEREFLEVSCCAPN